MLRDFEKYYFHRLELENLSFEAFLHVGTALQIATVIKGKDARIYNCIIRSYIVTETLIRISSWVYESFKRTDCVFIMHFSIKIRLARFKSSAFPARALPSRW